LTASSIQSRKPAAIQSAEDRGAKKIVCEWYFKDATDEKKVFFCQTMGMQSSINSSNRQGYNNPVRGAAIQRNWNSIFVRSKFEYPDMNPPWQCKKPNWIPKEIKTHYFQICQETRCFFKFTLGVGFVVR